MFSMYSSVVPIEKESILALLTPYDIFRYYVKDYELEKTISSPFHSDHHPSFWSTVNSGGRIWFKDFSKGISGDCFDLVMNIFDITFVEALNQINRDFRLGLGLSDTNFTEVKTRLSKFHLETPKPSQLANVRITPRLWEIYDLQYWAEHGISYATACKYTVVPIRFYWIRDYQFRGEHLAYSWKVYDKRKIYQPESEDHKWYGDLRSNYVQGLQQLPKRGKKLLLQSSLKDSMACLERYGIYGIAGSSETSPIPGFILDQLEKRFDEIYIVHDGDKAGWNSSTELAFQRRYVNVMLPQVNGVKDPSSYIKHRLFKQLDSLFHLYKVL